MDITIKLPEQKYQELNQRLSTAYGFAIGQPTEWYNSPNPEVDENGECEFFISNQTCEDYAEILADYTEI